VWITWPRLLCSETRTDTLSLEPGTVLVQLINLLLEMTLLRLNLLHWLRHRLHLCLMLSAQNNRESSTMYNVAILLSPWTASARDAYQVHSKDICSMLHTTGIQIPTQVTLCCHKQVYLLNEQFACWQLILSFIEFLVVLRLWWLQLCTVLYQSLGFRLHLADVQSCHREVLLDLLGTNLYASWLLLKLGYIQLCHRCITTELHNCMQ